MQLLLLLLRSETAIRFHNFSNDFFFILMLGLFIIALNQKKTNLQQKETTFRGRHNALHTQTPFIIIIEIECHF